MAVPSYTTDLTDISTAESTTNWSAYGGGASGLAVNPDSAMQGTNCVGKQVSAADKGQYYDNGSGITLGTGDHIFQWIFCTTPGLTDTRANKGVSVFIGTTSANYCQYHVEGNNTYGAAGRVGKCYPIDYSVRSTNASEPYRTATGTPGANPQLFGGGLVTTASVKGENCCIDANRYGTGMYLTAGELTAAGDGSNNPCTFAGAQTTNDYNDATNGYNRWGIFTLVGGSYEMQGTFAIGQNNSGTATLARFQDSDRNIVIVDTIHAASTFNKIIIDHASTYCYWTNISITALGTTAPGQLTVTSNDPIFEATGGTWTNIGAITLRSNTVLTGVTMRGTGLITQNSADITDCLIDASANTPAVLSNAPNLISGCTFVSAGTGYAIEITTPGTYTFAGNTFSGYGTTGTANAAIYNNSGGAVTLNITSGGSTPTYNNGTSATTTINSNVSITVDGLKDNTEVRVYNAGTTTYIDGIEDATSGTTNDRFFTFSVASGTAVDIRIHNVTYEATAVLNFSTTSDTTIPISQRFDRNYSNP